MRFAYADPPYVGLARLYDAAEVDHIALASRLCNEFPDGWAMSLHSPSLRDVLPLFPVECRVGAWVKPFCSFKPGVPIAYAWEPVLFMGGRKRTTTVRDWVSANITLKRGFTGAKPVLFGHWIFNLLGMEPEDEFVDLFPGSGAMARAWDDWKAQYLWQPKPVEVTP